LHKLPHEILRLPETEQAFLFAAISLKMKHDKEEAQKLKASKAKRRRR
jgi:hypothetical protein